MNRIRLWIVGPALLALTVTWSPTAAATGDAVPAATPGPVFSETTDELRLAQTKRRRGSRKAAFIPPRPRPKPNPNGSIESSGARLSARLGEGSEPLGAGVRWRIEGRDDTEFTATSSNPRPEIELAPGRYRAIAEAGAASAETEFAVEPDAVVVASVDLNAGRLAASVVPGEASMPFDNAVLRVRGAGDAASNPLLVEAGGRVEMVLPVGEFEVSASLGHTEVIKPVTIRAGRTTTVELVLAVGFVLAEAVAAEGTELLSGATFPLREIGAEPPEAEIARAGGRHPVFTVGPGEYLLRTRFGLAEVDQLVRVAANRLSRVLVTLDAARLEIAALGPDPVRDRDQPATFRILTGEGPGTLLTEVSETRPVFRLPAGTFVVEAARSGALARKVVDLRAGESRSLDLVLAAGELDVEVSSNAGPVDKAEVDIAATPIDGDGAASETPIDLGRLDTAPFLLPAGRYRLAGRLEPGGARAVSEVEIKERAADTAKLAFEVGTARLALLDKPDGAAIEDALWRLRAAGADRRTRVIGGAVEVKLPPGTYEVAAEAGERAAAGRLTIDSGKVAELTLVAE